MKKILLLIAAGCYFTTSQAQHTAPKDTTMHMMPHADTADKNKMEMDHTGMGDSMDMPGEMTNTGHSFSLHLPMNRNGSGTGWLPDASPMYGAMYTSAKWMYMLHGNLFLRYNNQDIANEGTRGGNRVDAPNWIMFMGQRRVGKKGLFHFNTMFSLDPVTIGGSGYPLLFQSGETYKGQALVDRQHPHDLFSELSVSYAHAFDKKTDVFLYLAYPGEPALGPVAFMHRPSALYNPDAPISHHWVDATHITFGVATLGVRAGKFKLEGSSFTSKEPDEERYGFDKPRFDSWSGRLSYNPSENWALQVSHGYLKSPERLHPAENIYKTTASAAYSLPLDNGSLNAIALWGMNKIKGVNGENAALLEASWQRKKMTWYGRYEFVQKSVEELVLDEAVYGHDTVFPVHLFSFGMNYDLFSIGQSVVSMGSQFSLYTPDDRLEEVYGKLPVSFEVYLRLYPGRMGGKK